ncbi:MAG: rhomboid family intramembrane serine protease [Hadesarchaea archaeon]|nr:rhomboid family intramembrane serine protease [Hadesarchaea archaeon]
MESRKVFPYATLVLILINVLIFVILEGTGALKSVNDQFGLRPAAILQGHVYLVVTSMFLHGALSHILGNMLFLLVFGIILERRIGAPRFLAIYFLTHFVAAMFDLAIRPGEWQAAYGASAAISGISGACFIGYPTARMPLSFGFLLILQWAALAILFLVPMPIATAYGIYLFISLGLPLVIFLLAPLIMAPLWPFVLVWFVFQLGFALFTLELGIYMIGWWAHLSGFLAGMLLILFLKSREPSEEFMLREEIPAIR